MSIPFRLYDSTGRKGARVSLALRRGDVANQLLKCLQDADLAKSGRFSIADLTRIDSGEFSVSSLPALGYSAAEIKEAIQRRMEEINSETDELKELERLLHDGTFGAAMGGERAVGRESALIASWQNTVQGARKSASSANLTREQKIAKSRAMGGGADCATILTAHNWEKTDGTKDRHVYTHGKIPGHEVHVHVPTEAWEHRKGARVLGASAREAGPQERVAHLNHHLLQQFHRP